jgi:GT2 family glycosyltransferase
MALATADSNADPTAGPVAAGAPALSVIVPVRDGGPAFARCLAALGRSTLSGYELVVVDDASGDDSAAVAAAHGARVVRLGERRGPAAARNAGARAARGELLFFLDADCEPAPDALERAAAELEREPALDAVFGSYDDRPAEPGLVSQFKNLFHHWTHQRGAGPASTFWAGCGAIRRRRFLELGGFDERRYGVPSIEDIELGYRLREAGGSIRLLPELQARHLKRWTLGNLVRTDLLRRGIPWTELLLERRGRSALNVEPRARLAVAAGTLAVAALPAIPFWGWAGAVSAAATAAMVGSSWSFYALVRRRCGALYALGAVPLHALYCVCCAGAFVVGAARAFGARRERPSA